MADTRPEIPASLQTDDERSLLALIDGKRTVAEILRVSRMSGFTAMRQLRALSERRIIRPLTHRAHTAPPQPAPAQPRVTVRGLNPVPPPVGFTQDLSSVADRFTEPAWDIPTPPPEPKITSRGLAPAAPAGRARATSSALVPVSLPRRVTPTPISSALVPVTPSQPLVPILPTPSSVTVAPRLGSMAAQAVDLWFSLVKRDWSTLAVIPAHRVGSALPLVCALAEAGSALLRRPVQMLSGEGKDLLPTTNWIFPRLPGDQHMRLIALEPISLNPMGIPVAQGAGAVLIVAEKGITDLATIRRTADAIGRHHLIGSVLVERDR